MTVDDPVFLVNTGTVVRSSTSEHFYQFKEMTEQEKNYNFQKISREMKSLEEGYSQCINKISSTEFTQDMIDGCLGYGYTYVLDDFDYVRRQLMARADSQVRSFFLSYCYAVAGTDYT